MEPLWNQLAQLGLAGVVILWLARALQAKDRELAKERDEYEQRIAKITDQHIADLRRLEDASRKSLDAFARALTLSRRNRNGDEGRGDEATRL